MLLGRPLRRMFGNEGHHDCLIFVSVLPGQHRVARQHAVAERVEAGAASAD